MNVRWSDGGAFAVIPHWLLVATVNDRPVSDKAIRLFAVLAASAQAPENGKQLSQRWIADQMGCATSSVRSAAGELVEVGALTIETARLGNGANAENVYVLHASPSTTPPTPADLSADPPADTPADYAGAILAGEENLDLDLPPVTPPSNLPSLPRAVPRKVDRIPVTVAEAELAAGVLAAYNELTGQGYASGDWLAKIVMRLREHPELVLDDHRRVLEVALAAPWWDGRPAPNVVYGNAALFERCLDAVLAAPLRNGAAASGGRKFGRRDVSAAEFEGLAERLKNEAELEGRKELESG